MIRLRDLLKLAPAALVLGLFVGCGEEPTTAPKTEGTVGKAVDKVEKAGEKAVDKIEKTGEKAVDAVDKAIDKADGAVKDAAATAVGEPPK